VISLTMTAAQQLGENNIRVNSICPGVTMTDLVATMVAKRSRDRNVSQDDIMAEMSADIPLKRPNQPEDMGAMAAFLASPGARNISGQNYTVDGGLVPS
jgi:3-oxoacyl-[acyl-carrier protein] reductase